MFRKTFVYSTIVAALFILQSHETVSAEPLNCVITYICVDSGQMATNEDRAFCRGAASAQYSTGVVLSPEVFASAAIPVGDNTVCPKTVMCKDKENWPCIGINQKEQ